MIRISALLATAAGSLLAAPAPVRLEAPQSVRQFEIAEFVVHVAEPRFTNPFVDVQFSGEFRAENQQPVRAIGFCDAPDGRLFRLRFSPAVADVTYRYVLNLRGGGIGQTFRGEFRSVASGLPGPVVLDPEYPKHFRFSGSGKPFFHLGYTAYHLLDPSRSDEQVDATLDYCVRMGFNKIRFLLTGYPRDTQTGRSTDVEHGVPDADAAKRPNYGAPAGRMNPLPAWEGSPHQYDFTRFHLPYWRRIERAIQEMQKRGILATCIVTIEKQDLPQEYGSLTPQELLLYRYAVARLSAFSNVWWDLGNEHNEFRDTVWGDAMGHVVRALDPHRRLRSAHAYEAFPYTKSGWADYIITQHYGDERAVYAWARNFAETPMPYVNEEYGYEGPLDKPGHLQNADWVRRNHWAISMAGGYATYGDWSNGVSYFYTGDPGPGKAAPQLRHLRTFFEALPFRRMMPCGESAAWTCLADAPDTYVLHFPRGEAAEIGIRIGNRKLAGRWFDPRTGAWRPGPEVSARRTHITPPGREDWVLLLTSPSP
jgi:hypothetical protein